MTRVLWVAAGLCLAGCGGEKDEERCECDECEDAIVECEAEYEDRSREEQDCQDAALLLCAAL